MRSLSPGFRIFLLTCLLTLLAGAATCAYAQTHTLTCTSSQACVAWRAAPGWSDGTPFAAGTQVSYNVYSQMGNQVPVLRGTTQGLEIRIVGLPPGRHFFFIRTVVGLVESLNSNIAEKMIRFPGPTDGSIEAPRDGAIENR